MTQATSRLASVAGPCDTWVMPARVLPSKTELRQMLDSGMTHAQIAAEVSRQTGRPVRRSTVSSAIHRAGLSGPHKLYEEELPWTIKEKHLTAYPPRMLRLLGRRRAGVQNSAEMDARLDAWLAQLRREHAVVAYVPETDQGWFYVDGEPDADGIPITRELKL